jgi:hypothetical protein
MAQVQALNILAHKAQNQRFRNRLHNLIDCPKTQTTLLIAGSF